VIAELGDEAVLDVRCSDFAERDADRRRDDIGEKPMPQGRG